MNSHAKEAVIWSSGRIGRYLWALAQLAQEGQVLATSREISEIAGGNATQVRRDLAALLGRSGKRGVGYNVRRTLDALRSQTTFSVLGDGPVAAAFSDGATLALLGIVAARGSERPDVAVLDYLDPTFGRSAAASLAHAGVSLIVHYGPYLLDSDLTARVIYASPLLTFAEAVT